MIQFSLRDGEFIPWHPLPNLSQELVLSSLTQEGDQLTVRFAGESGRGMTVVSQSCLAINSVALDPSDPLGVAVEQELLPLGRFWQVVGGALPGFRGGAFGQGEIACHHVILADERWIEIVATETVHVSWDDNFFGDAL